MSVERKHRLPERDNRMGSFNDAVDVKLWQDVAPLVNETFHLVMMGCHQHSDAITMDRIHRISATNP